VVAELTPRIAALKAELPRGYHIAEGGIAEESATSRASVFAVVPLMLLLMITVLMFQLQSFRKLGIILAMLPLSRVMGIITQVAFPAISQLHRDKRDIRPELLNGLRLTAYVVIPALWGIASIAPWFVRVALGSHWSSAALPLQIVCAVLPLRLIGTLTATAVQGVGRPDIDLKNSLTGVVVLPPCFLVGGMFGTTGLACGWLVGLPVLMAINISRAQPVLGISIFDALKEIARPAACSAVMFVAVRVVAAALGEAANTAWGLGLMILVGAGAYAACVWMIDRAALVVIWGVLRPGRMRPAVPSA
jgi:O-antigen/teichoic acid export membrane protein